MLRFLFALSPNLAETVYSRGIFQAVRFVLDFTLGWLPFPTTYLLVILLVFWGIRRIIRKKEKKPWKVRLKRFGLNSLTFLAAGFFLFNILWGFNYQRIPVSHQLDLDLSDPTETEIRKGFQHATEALIAARAAIPQVTDSALTSDFLPEKFETETREALKTVLQEAGYPTPGRVRGRKLFPGVLRRVGPIGIYIPFAGEGTIDGSLLAQRVPSTLAHELAHGYGFADEGDCNFWAWLACTESDIPIFQYSGWMSFWRYAASEFRRIDPQGYKQKYEALPLGIRNDLDAMRENSRKYSGWASDLGSKVNDMYLKSQGVKEGTRKYAQMFVMVLGWEKKN